MLKDEIETDSYFSNYFLAGIRQLQCILLKVALLLGVEVHEGVTFEELLEPPEDQSQCKLIKIPL